MNLYQFTLEARTRDGVNSYEHKEFVLAETDAMASRFANEFAQHWQPNATYDTHLDTRSDSAPEGWLQWTLASCAPISHLTVPVAGKQLSVQVALVPEIEAKT
ncbi:hypothetical protein ANRL3_00858 [Anaerolineae bacterium]|nr:hypothetical protein ANRL3_00858 [Anaerolineae bacterium]